MGGVVVGHAGPESTPDDNTNLPVVALQFMSLPAALPFSNKKVFPDARLPLMTHAL